MDLPMGLDKKFLDSLFAAAASEHGEIAVVRNIQKWEKIGEIRVSTLDDAVNSLVHARVMAESWSRVGGFSRSRILYRFLRQIVRYRNPIVALSQLLSGKSWIDAGEEYLDILTQVRSMKRALKHVAVPRRGRGQVPFSFYRVMHRPLGVVGFFSSSDFQLSMVGDILNALMMGNPVVNFVTPQAALGALMMKGILVSSGLPADAWRIVVSPTVDLGIKIIPGLDYVSIAASSDTCNQVARQCGYFSVPMSSFGSFKNIAIILEDARLWEAAKACARSAFRNAGQSLSGLEVIFVQEQVKESFEELVTQYTRDQLRVGTYADRNATVGAMLNPQRVERSQRAVRFLTERGGRILVGSHARPEVSETFFEPTIVTDVKAVPELLTEEFYGPLVAIVSFEDVTDVVRYMESSRLVNAAYLFTQDMEFVSNFIENSAVSTVSVNDSYMSLWGAWRAPIQGREETGQGIRHGVEAMLQYTRVFSAVRLKRISWVSQDWRSGNWTERLTFSVMGINSWLAHNVTDTVWVQGFKLAWRRLQDRFSGPV
ncbi:aldehyde dehydrogenase family protein [Mobiluncus mulieris]|uniref:Aldehyde dehydrogenase family protein n=1 Tax=Mobiluncus mulieris TaxID=2052 RepID=A0A7Y0URS9_9ACTO|nr:aldehyde dehydrogenase family protein [Mobiluncus mulieris]MCU9972783.1 aldehyde dehydrogenase family protein [Mobiluncus mulieris]MCU9993847.1 aldehyde dehydrogenase family protein [Mobiluncus mulieris]MCU9995556.1 aldehyde dehydrogenase family protein [Mobiluncus mulieris]MCV0009004.1 aldehyde dehydrogenase family protein [Mobiluncus mulieris]NMW59750.1 aldehyde dehydrogenase family protein [Mobiluncus mulieris]